MSLFFAGPPSVVDAVECTVPAAANGPNTGAVDVAVTMAADNAQLQLNVMEPLIVHHALEGTALLSRAVQSESEGRERGGQAGPPGGASDQEASFRDPLIRA